MGIIQAILAVLKIISFVDKWLPIVLKWFQKDPIEQVKESEKKHDEASKKAELDDDTSGSFNG